MAYFKQREEKQHQQVFLTPVVDEEADAYPLSYEDELEEQKREHWRLAAGVMDFLGVIVGVLVILLMVAVIISLVNWVMEDLTQSFTLIQAWRR